MLKGEDLFIQKQFLVGGRAISITVPANHLDNIQTDNFEKVKGIWQYNYHKSIIRPDSNIVNRILAQLNQK